MSTGYLNRSMQHCYSIKGYFVKHKSTLRGTLDNVSGICVCVSSLSYFDMPLHSLNFLISRYASWVSLSSSLFSHQLIDTVEAPRHLEHNNEHVTYPQKLCHKIPHIQHNLP